MNNNGGVCVMDVINMLSNLAVDCEFLSKEENSTFNSLPIHFRNTAIGATMRNLAVTLDNVAGEVRYLAEQLQSVIE